MCIIFEDSVNENSSSYISFEDYLLNDLNDNIRVDKTDSTKNNNKSSKNKKTKKKSKKTKKTENYIFGSVEEGSFYIEL
jgi:hypothetical protein